MACAHIRADFFHDSQLHWLLEKHLLKISAEYCLMPVLAEVMVTGGGTMGGGGGAVTGALASRATERSEVSKLCCC